MGGGGHIVDTGAGLVVVVVDAGAGLMVVVGRRC